LAIAEPLHHEPWHQTPFLLPLHGQGYRGTGAIYEQEGEVVDEDFEQGVAVELIGVLQQVIARLSEAPDESDIDQRCEQRKQELEQPSLRQRNEAERAAMRVQRHATVFPQALQGTEGPAEALF